MIVYTTKPDSIFLANEVNAFKKHANDLVVIYEIDLPVPENIQSQAKYIHLGRHSQSLDIWFILKHLRLFIQVLSILNFKEFVKDSLSGHGITQLIRCQNALARFLLLSEENIALLKKQEFVLSFWFYDILFPLFLKKRRLVKRVYARAHRGDIYEGEVGVNKLFFREAFLTQMDGLFPISENGTEFLKMLYPRHSQKIKTFYLGSTKTCTNEEIQGAEGSQLHIVSCSWVNNKKRVQEIPHILKALKRPFKWVHFGRADAEHQKLLEEAIEKTNIAEHIELRGATENVQIQEYYASHHIDCFLSVSSTEGVPVSFMEAISYGIPVVSTDVGGCNEIVNNQTGVLLPLEASHEAFASAITDCSNKNRELIVSFWKNSFDITKLTTELYSTISRSDN